MIEPSNTERAEWPDTTRDYVEGLESKLEAAERAATLSCENCVRDPVSCEWIRVCIARGFKYFVLKPSLKALTQEDKGDEL
jgi:hypothetical protein